MRCVPAHDFTVAKAMAWRTAIHDDPPYQREGSVWSLDKRQLFIDSLLNGYDVPKIYLHDLRGQVPILVYTVVDGRQRLGAIWGFLRDEFPLADDFKVIAANRPPLPDGAVDPVGGQRFSELDPAWKQVLRRTYIAVVLIQNATEDDIEDLFSRLNNGEPLTAAEKRNAMGGAMAELARQLVKRPFFADRLRFADARYAHLELATRILLVEHADPSGVGPAPDVRSRALDAFIRSNRRLSRAAAGALRRRAEASVAALESVFESRDPLLSRASVPLLYHLFVRAVAASAPERLPEVRPFLERFQAARLAALRTTAPSDPALVEFTHLMQHGTNEARSLDRRRQILVDAFGMGAEAARRSA